MRSAAITSTLDEQPHPQRHRLPRTGRPTRRRGQGPQVEEQTAADRRAAEQQVRQRRLLRAERKDSADGAAEDSGQLRVFAVTLVSFDIFERRAA